MGKNLLKNYHFLSVNFVNRNCNFCAHKLAKWARLSSVSGRLDLTIIPPKVLCDRGGTDIF